jgi:hypothetical protein
MHRAALSLVFASVVLYSAGSVIAQAPASWLGTWKLNPAKSQYEPASLAPKSQTAKQTASGESVTTIVDGVDAAGKPIHTEITYKFDGNEYEYKGAPDPRSTRIYTRIDDRNYQFVTKVNGQITTTSYVAVAPDGKTRTIVTRGRDAQGQIISNLAWWDRQ